MDIYDCKWSHMNSFIPTAACGYFMRLLSSAFTASYWTFSSWGFQHGALSKKVAMINLVSNCRAEERQCMGGPGTFAATSMAGTGWVMGEREETEGACPSEELGFCAFCWKRTGISGKILSREMLGSAQSGSQETLWIPWRATMIELGGADGPAPQPPGKGWRAALEPLPPLD